MQLRYKPNLLKFLYLYYCLTANSLASSFIQSTQKSVPFVPDKKRLDLSIILNYGFGLGKV